MNPFLLYLIGVNVVTFIAFVIDFFLCKWKPEIDDTAANSIIMDIFPIAGGAVGMLLAMFVITGLGNGRRMNKDNIAWWFLAIVCLIVWGLFVTMKFDIVILDGSIGALFSNWITGRLKFLSIYLGVINIVTFFAFAIDKYVALNGNDFNRRFPEARLLGLCLIGGSVGGLLAMYIFRHKIRKWYFVWGLSVFIVLGVVAILYAHMSGLI